LLEKCTRASPSGFGRRLFVFFVFKTVSDGHPPPPIRREISTTALIRPQLSSGASLSTLLWKQPPPPRPLAEADEAARAVGEALRRDKKLLTSLLSVAARGPACVRGCRQFSPPTRGRQRHISRGGERPASPNRGKGGRRSATAPGACPSFPTRPRASLGAGTIQNINKVHRMVFA